jgi:hypothetical protein
MINILAFKYSSQELSFNEFMDGKRPKKSKEITIDYDTHDFLYPVDCESKYGNALSQMYYYFGGSSDNGKFKVHHSEDTLNTNEPYLIYVEYQPDSSTPGPTRQMKYVFTEGLDSKHIENIRKGIAKIWFDCTPEERIGQGEPLNELFKFLDKIKIPHSSILYTDGDQLVDELFEKHSKDIQVKVLPLHMNNAWESFQKLANDNLWSRLIVNQEYFLRPKHFMFNNFMPRVARVILMAELVKSKIYKKGFCSFQDIGEDGNIFFPSMGDASFADRSFNIYEICHANNNLKDHSEFKRNYIDVIRDVLPLSHDMIGLKQEDTLDNLDYTTARISDSMTLAHAYEHALEDEGKRTLTHYDSTYGPYYNPISYLNVYFDVCAETYSGGFHQDKCPGPVFTEKVYRPLALGTPFLPVSEPGSIKALRRQGFKMYDNMFDYSFDEEKHGPTRIKMIYDNIKRLTDMSREELHKLTYSHKKEMVYNHEYFINDFYHNVYENHLKFLTEWVR